MKVIRWVAGSNEKLPELSLYPMYWFPPRMVKFRVRFARLLDQHS